MKPFHLTIVTPYGKIYDGQAESLTVRTIDGDVGILAGHIDYLTALGMGLSKVIIEGKTRRAACIGGMLSVSHGEVTLVATTFEWAEEIDVDRAQRSAARAQAVLDSRSSHTSEEIALAEARLKRALVRTGAAK